MGLDDDLVDAKGNPIENGNYLDSRWVVYLVRKEKEGFFAYFSEERMSLGEDGINPWELTRLDEEAVEKLIGEKERELLLLKKYVPMSVKRNE